MMSAATLQEESTTLAPRPNPGCIALTTITGATTAAMVKRAVAITSILFGVLAGIGVASECLPVLSALPCQNQHRYRYTLSS